MPITHRPETWSITHAGGVSRLRVTEPGYASLAADRRGVRFRGTVATAFVDVTPRDLSAILATIAATWAPARTLSDAS